MTPIPVSDGELITAPGLYVMSEAWYHSDPCEVPSLSCSLAKYALPMGSGSGTARHLWQNHPRLNPPDPAEADDSHRFDLGSVFHTLILGKGEQIVVIEASDWRTKAAKEAREAAIKANCQPVLAEQMKRAEAMVAAARPQIAMREDLAYAMSSGMPEVVLVWIEETPAGGVWCRCKLDWLPTDGRIFPDWKSTGASAGPDEYGRTYFDIGADFDGIPALHDRVLEFVEADFLAGVKAGAEILALEHLLKGDAGVEAEDFLVGHFPEPVAVVNNLGLGFVEDLERLVGVGGGVGEHFVAGEWRAGGGTAGGVADGGGEVTDEKHGLMT
jgi:hypothetical protein